MNQDLKAVKEELIKLVKPPIYGDPYYFLKLIITNNDYTKETEQLIFELLAEIIWWEKFLEYCRNGK